jgi:hypothetical protein
VGFLFESMVVNEGVQWLKTYGIIPQVAQLLAKQ